MLRRVCPGRVNQVWLPGSLSQILTEAAKTNTEGNGLAEIMGSGCREGTGVRTNSPKQKMGNGLLAEAKESHRTPRWSLVIECPPVLPPCSLPFRLQVTNPAPALGIRSRAVLHGVTARLIFFSWLCPYHTPLS